MRTNSLGVGLRRGLSAVAVAMLALLSCMTLPVEAAPFAYGVQSPANGERLTRADAITIIGFAEVANTERVDKVEARLMREGEVFAAERPMEPLDAQEVRAGVTRSRWQLRVHPYSSPWVGGALPNGPLTIQVRVFTSFGNMESRATQWQGHPVIVDIDPPDTAVRATVLDAKAHSVQIDWEAVNLPDFTRYVVQRAVGEGEDWENLGQVSASERVSFVDHVPDYDVYRYRVRVFRAAASQGERGSQWSAAAVVSVAEPPPPAEPASAEGESGGSGEPARGEAPPPAPPRVTVQRAPAPRAPQPPDVYSETLDYSDVATPQFAEQDDPSEPGAPEPQAAGRGSGMLELEDREFLPQRVLVPVAAGLLFTLGAWHVRRFMRT